LSPNQGDKSALPLCIFLDFNPQSGQLETIVQVFFRRSVISGSFAERTLKYRGGESALPLQIFQKKIESVSQPMTILWMIHV